MIINQSCISAIFQHIQRNTSELQCKGWSSVSSGDIIGRIAINMNLSLVVVWSRVILILRCSKLGGFFGVVLDVCCVAARCSVGHGEVDWSISVVFLFHVARKSSFGVEVGTASTLAASVVVE